MTTIVTPALPVSPVAAPAPPVVRLRLLGESAIDVDQVPVGPESQVLFALLLVLALERGRRLARTALHRLLWPAADDDSGRHNLRQVLYKLRQLGVPVDATPSSVMLPAGVVTGELVALTSGDPTIGTRLAAGRHLGDFLPGYAPSFSAPFADWLDEQRSLVQAQLRRALLAALTEVRALGQWREVESIAREVLRVDLLNEEATLALAEATALVGAKAQALGIIDRYLHEVGGRPADLKLPATLLRRRIAERFPTHRYVSAADACFVGRAAEMATLLGLWHRARERRGGAVLLWGEPGIGKTRLAHELGRVATLQGAQVQRVASRSWDVQRPLGAIVDLVPGLRELPGAAGVDPACNEYLDRLTKHDPDRPLTDLPDPATLHRQVRQAVFDLVDALLAEAPLVLVLEDVQWLDASSWEVVAELLRLARTRRLLLVLTSRAAQPAQMPESEDWEALRRLRLDGIDAAATNELLDAMTREAGKYIDPDYREWCVPLANGNPLHAQEIALQWLEKGSVREAPGSLKAMIESRLAALPDTSLEVLRAVTLLARQATPRQIESVLAEPPVKVIAAADELEREGFIRTVSGLLVVRHDLIGQWAHDGMTDAAKLLLHSRIAKSLLSAVGRQHDPHVLWDSYTHSLAAFEYADAAMALCALADHFVHSGKPDVCERLLFEALTTLKDHRCADTVRSRLVAISAHLGHWEQAAALLHECDNEILQNDADQLLFLLEARWKQDGDLEKLRSEALSLVRRAVLPPATRIRAATWALVFAENSGDNDCHQVTRPLVDPLIRRLGATRIYGAHYQLLEATQRRDITDTRRSSRRLAHFASTLPNGLDKARLLRHASHGLRMAGQLGDAKSVLMETVEVCTSIAAVHSLALTEAMFVSLCLRLHDTAEAKEWIARAERSCSQTDDAHGKQTVAFLKFQIDVAEMNYDRAASQLPILGSPTPGDTNRTRQANRLACQLRLCDQLGMTPDTVDAAIAESIDLLCRNNASDATDFAASAIIHALWFIGGRQRAAKFRSRYLGEIRFCRGPLDLDLFLTHKRIFGSQREQANAV